MKGLLNCLQRSGLAAGLAFITVSPERKLIKDKKEDVTNKSQLGLRPPKQKLNSEQKVQMSFRPPALQQTRCWQ